MGPTNMIVRKAKTTDAAEAISVIRLSISKLCVADHKMMPLNFLVGSPTKHSRNGFNGSVEKTQFCWF